MLALSHSLLPCSILAMRNIKSPKAPHLFQIPLRTHVSVGDYLRAHDTLYGILKESTYEGAVWLGEHVMFFFSILSLAVPDNLCPSDTTFN